MRGAMPVPSWDHGHYASWFFLAAAVAAAHRARGRQRVNTQHMSTELLHITVLCLAGGAAVGQPSDGRDRGRVRCSHA